MPGRGAGQKEEPHEEERVDLGTGGADAAVWGRRVPGGVTEAVLGETVSTRWFDCTVEEAEARKSYESDTASGGNKLVVVELELKNTFHEAVSMYDTDFQLYWGECGPDEWAMPLDPYCEDQLPREYDLEPGKSREGLLVYEVPQEETEFTLAFLELIENGTEEGEEGDLFLTRFTVE